MKCLEYMKCAFLQCGNLHKALSFLSTPTDDNYRPETAPFGFFSELSRSVTDPGEEPCYPSGPSGYLPNSVLVKILYPPPPPTPASREATPYRPPVLTPGQLAEIQSLHAVSAHFCL